MVKVEIMHEHRVSPSFEDPVGTALEAYNISQQLSLPKQWEVMLHELDHALADPLSKGHYEIHTQGL